MYCFLLSIVEQKILITKQISKEEEHAKCQEDSMMNIIIKGGKKKNWATQVDGLKGQKGMDRFQSHHSTTVSQWPIN